LTVLLLPVNCWYDTNIFFSIRIYVYHITILYWDSGGASCLPFAESFDCPHKGVLHVVGNFGSKLKMMNQPILYTVQLHRNGTGMSLSKQKFRMLWKLPFRIIL
jgi:hypothetical protein